MTDPVSQEGHIDPAIAAQELLRRRRARESFEVFCETVDLPGRPVDSEEDEFEAVETALAQHHRIICRAVQRCVERKYGRLMVFAGPGSAKSTYCTVAAPAWVMGKWPGTRAIITSHGSKIATKQSKRARQLARSLKYRRIFGTGLPADERAADEWALENGSRLMAGGILSGITGNRAEMVVIDDPHSSREDAESPTMREKVWNEYQDSIRTRLVPGGSMIIVQTRWHEDDLSGMILPREWDGESGVFQGTDGLQWEVVCLRSKIENERQAETDPLGRKVGEYIWPEWFTREHWVQNDPALGSVSANSISGRRAWGSMHQQTPKPAEGVLFLRDSVKWYDPSVEGSVPKEGTVYGASDWAVTENVVGNDPDYTEHGVVKVTPDGDVYFLDWRSGRERTNVTIGQWLGLVRVHRPRCWFGERGVIENAIGPAVERAMREAEIFVNRELLPVVGDKVARVMAFQGLWEAGKIHLPLGKPWAERLVTQLCGFPSVRFDDMVDVCGMFGRAWDMMRAGRGSVGPEKKEGVVPFSIEWLMSKDTENEPAVEERYYT